MLQVFRGSMLRILRKLPVLVVLWVSALWILPVLAVFGREYCEYLQF